MTGTLLEGLRVVEVSSFVAAPLGGMTLAQLGAEVIRVDPPGGGPDFGRWPVTAAGTSLYWAGLNKGKRSVTADLRSPEGRARVTELVTRAGEGGGILLTNAAGRGALDDAELRALRPDLIHLRVLGRHDGGPAVDYTVNAATGFPLVTGPPDHDGPVNHVLPVWDVTCGLYAALGIAAAERRRARTGEGCLVTVALRDVALAMAGNLGYLAEAQAGITRERIGNHLYGGFARDFACSDGERLMVVALTPRHWRDLVAVTGTAAAVTALEEGLGADFTQDADRYLYREALAALLGRWFAAHTLAEVTKELAATSVVWDRYRSFTDLAADLDTHPLMNAVDQPGAGTHLAPGSPLGVDGHHAPAVPAPQLGADDEAIWGGTGVR